MQCSKRKAPIGLAAGIGARTTHNILERTEMNTSTHRKAPATKAKLGAVTISGPVLTSAELNVLTSFRGMADYEREVFVLAIAKSAARQVQFASRMPLRLIQGGAA
jgi:hypothetical protein